MDDEKDKDGDTAQEDRPEEKAEPVPSPPPDLDIVREERRRIGEKGWGKDD